MAEGKTIGEALCAAQGRMSNPRKDKVAEVRTKSGGKYQYSYTTLDAVLDVVRPALNSEGIYLTQRSESVGDGMLLRTSVCYGDQSIELDATPYEYDRDPQEFGKRETYARRYSLLKAFGLAGVEDTDGDTGPGGSEPPRSRHDRRRVLADRLNQVLQEKVDAGFNASSMYDYIEDAYHKADASELTDAELVEVGKWLKAYEVQA